MKKSEILSINREDIRYMSDKEIRELVKSGSRIANLHLASLSLHKVPSAAFRKRFGKGYFTYKGIDEVVDGKHVITPQQARRKAYEVYDWLNLKSSTVSGAKKIFLEQQEKFGDTSDITDEVINKYELYWELYNVLKDYVGSAFVGDSTQVQYMLDDYVNKKDEKKFSEMTTDEIYKSFQDYAMANKDRYGSASTYFYREIEDIKESEDEKEKERIKKRSEHYDKYMEKIKWDSEDLNQFLYS